MPTITVKTASGADSGSLDLADAIFGIEPNGPVMHQVVTAQLAARRAGTHSTKTRAEVRGGAAKPWRQKGTGRARAGSSNSPNWRGGGVAMGPRPRKYNQRTPKKMVRLALRSALSDRAAEGKVIVVDSLGFDSPRTKDAIAFLDAVGATGRVLVVLPRDDEAGWKSFRNLGHVHVASPGELNAYDVLVSDVVVFTTATVPTTDEVVKPKPASKPEAAAKPKPAAKPEPAAKPDAAAAAPADQEPVPVLADPAVDSDGDGEANPDDESPFGEASARPLEDGSAPSDEYTIKGNAGSMLYHPPSSPFYGRTKAEVWFTTAEAAEAAGFSLPPSLRKDDAAEGEEE
jgi:large subunit ribosomal protein L4